MQIVQQSSIPVCMPASRYVAYLGAMRLSSTAVVYRTKAHGISALPVVASMQAYGKPSMYVHSFFGQAAHKTVSSLLWHVAMACCSISFILM